MGDFQNKLKLKVQNYAFRFKGVCVNLWEKSMPLYQKIIANKKKILIGLIAVVVLAGVGVSSFYLLRWWKFRNESPTFSAIRKAEIAATGQVGSKVMMGNLEITLIDTIEGFYRPLEVDEAGKRVPAKDYFGAKVMIFNTDYNQTDLLLFGLTDEFGNQYERDFGIEFYMDKDKKDFGPAREIYPRTIRGDTRYLLFPAPGSDAKKLQLMVMSETQNKKIIFEIER